VVRLPNGRRLWRRFPPSSQLQLVVDWVAISEPDIFDFQLVSNFPRVVVGAEQLKSTLLELEMHPSTSLFVKELDDTD